MSNQSKIANGIQVGDTVAYSQSFIDRQHRYPDKMPSARGKVNVLHSLDKGIIMADITWNEPGLPKRVNIKNIVKAKAADSV